MRSSPLTNIAIKGFRVFRSLTHNTSMQHRITTFLMKLLITVLCLMFTALPSSGQETQPPRKADKSNQANTRCDQLKSPTFVIVELVPMPRDVKNQHAPYEQGDRITYKLLMTHSCPQPVVVLAADMYYQDRPELTRNGVIVPYRTKINQLVKLRDERMEVFSEKPITIEPGEKGQIALIDLRHWFGTLMDGHYELTLRHRFVWEGAWVQANSVTFEIR